MRQYETGFLVSPNLTEEETDNLILQMAEVISRKKGKMLKEDRWGKRKLAYPINKFEEAFYVFFHYEGEHDVPSELERRFKQTDTILRYLTVKREPKENIKKQKKPVKAREKEAEMPEAEFEEEVVEKKVEPEAVEKKVEEDIMGKEDLSPEEPKEEEK